MDYLLLFLEWLVVGRYCHSYRIGVARVILVVSRLQQLHFILVGPDDSHVDASSRRHVMGDLALGLVYLLDLDLYRRIILRFLILCVAVLLAIPTHCCCLNHRLDLQRGSCLVVLYDCIESLRPSVEVGASEEVRRFAACVSIDCRRGKCVSTHCF